MDDNDNFASFKCDLIFEDGLIIGEAGLRLLPTLLVEAAVLLRPEGFDLDLIRLPGDVTAGGEINIVGIAQGPVAGIGDHTETIHTR